MAEKCVLLETSTYLCKLSIEKTNDDELPKVARQIGCVECASGSTFDQIEVSLYRRVCCIRERHGRRSMQISVSATVFAPEPRASV